LAIIRNNKGKVEVKGSKSNKRKSSQDSRGIEIKMKGRIVMGEDFVSIK